MSYYATREIDLAPLREAFHASGRTLADIARTLGWSLHGRPDSGRVSRALGIRPYNPGRGQPNRLRAACSYEMAVRLAEAIGADPYEVGL